MILGQTTPKEGLMKVRSLALAAIATVIIAYPATAGVIPSGTAGISTAGTAIVQPVAMTCYKIGAAYCSKYYHGGGAQSRCNNRCVTLKCNN
jgi:hypothetical protein